MCEQRVNDCGARPSSFPRVPLAPRRNGFCNREKAIAQRSAKVPRPIPPAYDGDTDFGELPSGLTSASSVEPSLRVEDSRAETRGTLGGVGGKGNPILHQVEVKSVGGLRRWSGRSVLAAELVVRAKTQKCAGFPSARAAANKYALTPYPAPTASIGAFGGDSSPPLPNANQPEPIPQLTVAGLLAEWHALS